MAQVQNLNTSVTYTTIQAAVDDAFSGDNLLVYSGIYYENVNVTKQLTLRGNADEVDLNFERHFGRDTWDVAVSGNFAYIADDCNGLIIVNISNPSSPTMVGFYETPGIATGIDVSGDYAYIADFDNGLVIVNISNPTAPTFAGNSDTTGFARDVVVSGIYAYVADDFNALLIFNISDPTSPTLAGSNDTIENAKGVNVSGNYAYVADGLNGLVIVNISNPSTPTIEGSYDTAGFAEDVAVSGDYAYIADFGSLEIVNISDPTTPSLTGSYGYDTDEAFGVTVAGNYAYVADGYGLLIVNISNKTVPTYKGRNDTAGGGSDVVISDNYSYMASHINGLVIVNISNLSTPAFEGRFSSDTWEVVVSGNYAYIADDVNGLLIANISNPAEITMTGFYDTAGIAEAVAVSGSYAYIADFDNGLLIVDISNPTAPNLTGSFITPGFAEHVTVSGNYAYVTDNTGLMIVNISDPASPTSTGSYNTTDAMGIAVSGDYAYIANGLNGLLIVNISDPTAPTSTGSINTTGFAEDVAVSGDYAYIADFDSLVIVNISNKSSPTFAASYDKGDAFGVTLSGNYAYVAVDYNGLLILNISDPTAPTFAGSYDTEGAANDVAVSGNYVYVADHANGIVILQMSPSSAGLPVVDAMQSGSAITLSADGCTVDGFIVINCNTTMYNAGIYVASDGNNISNITAYNNDLAGIFLENSSGNNLTNNLVFNNTYGIVLFNSSSNIIDNNKALNNAGDSRNDSPSSTGILILGSNNIVKNNNASYNYIGIGVFSEGPNGDIATYNNIIENNTILNNSIPGENGPSDLIMGGIIVASTSNDTLKNNSLLDNFLNIVIDSSINITVLANTVSNSNDGNVGVGIWFENSNDSKITVNDVSRGMVGLVLINSSNNDINNNHIYKCAGNGSPGEVLGIGIIMDESSNNNISSNNVSENWNGIFLLKSSQNILDNNTANNNIYAPAAGDEWPPNIGFYLDNSNDNTFIQNTASNNNYGIYLINSSNNRLNNNNAHDNTESPLFEPASSGIYLQSSNDNILIDNFANNNWYGIYLNYSNDNSLINNTADSNWFGFRIFYSTRNILTNNIANSNTASGLMVGAFIKEHWNHSIGTSNFINGRGVYYYYDIHDQTIIGLNTTHLTIAGSTNITIVNSNISSGDGICVAWTDNSNISDTSIISNSATGIWFDASNDNIIENNIIESNKGHGIDLFNSSNTTILKNTINNNNIYGIGMSNISNYNKIFNNEIYSNGYGGIGLAICAQTQTANNEFNIIWNNTVYANNGDGIRIFESSNNTISSNWVENNSQNGVGIYTSTSNLIYNNYFNNPNNAYDDSFNIWNISKTPGTNIIGGSYLGGNYWSDYSGEDYTGDGLGDTSLPYNSEGNIQTGGDWLPLTTHVGSSTNQVCAAQCHNFEKHLGITTDFYPDGNTSFDRYVAFQGFLNEMEGTPMNITDPTIELYYDTGELYGDNFDYFEKVRPTVWTPGYAYFEFEDMYVTDSDGSYGINEGERYDTLGFNVSRVVENDGWVTQDGNITVTVSAVLSESVNGFISLDAALWNQPEFNAWVVDWNMSIPPDNLDYDYTGSNQVHVNFGTDGVILPEEYTLTVTFCVDKIIPANITVKPWVSVYTRDNIQDFDGGTGPTATINGTMFNMSTIFNSSNSNLNWKLQESYEKVISMEGGLVGVMEPYASFSLNKDFYVGTDNDSLSSGMYDSYLWYNIDVYNEADASTTVLGDLSFNAEADDIFEIYPEEDALWNSTYVNWIFPSEFIIEEDDGFGTGFSTNRLESGMLNVSIDRWMNRTVFNDSGYQLVTFNVTFDNTDFEWVMVHIAANEHHEVNASIVPDTFIYNAPIDGFDEWDHGIHLDLDKDSIQPGVTYNFSVVLRADLTGKEAPPILYKPVLSVVMGLYYDSTFLEGYAVEMPPTMLPDFVNYASVETNVSNAWMLKRHNHIIAELEEVSELAGPHARFMLNENFIVNTQDDTITSGIYDSNLWYSMDINNVDDDSDTVMGYLNLSAQANNITMVEWEEYAVKNNNYVNWTYPSELVLKEYDGLGTGFSTNYSESRTLNVSIDRWMNQTVFNDSGYQLVTFNVTFDNTDFAWGWADINVNEHHEVDASIVPGTVTYNVPVESFNEWEHGANFEFDQNAIQSGVTYNFSVIIKVNLTGNEAPPILYKPQFLIGMGTYYNSTVSQGYKVEMPQAMLPDYVTYTSVETNISNTWLLQRHNCDIAELSEVSELVGPHAQFSLNKDFIVNTQDDTITSGTYGRNLWYYLDIHNDGDDSDTVLGNLEFSAQADNITELDWDEHADWNNTHVNWIFPADFVLDEYDGFSTRFSTNYTESKNLNVSLSRWMNLTEFDSSGYQLATFNVTFEDTDFEWVWARIEANDRHEVDASIVPDTWTCDAPLWDVDEWDHGVHFDFDKDSIQPGVTYNFSVMVRVNLTGNEAPPILYKPQFSVGMGLYYNSTFLEGSTVDMPPAMLPDFISHASVGTNVSNVWMLKRHNHIIAELSEVSELAGPRAEFAFDKNFVVSTDNDTIISGTYDPYLWYWMEIHNEDDTSDTMLGDLNFSALADNITGVDREEYALWNSTHVNWTFPSSEFVLEEDDGFGTGFSTNYPESKYVNVSVSRWMNQTEFDSSGYQLATFNVTFEDTDFEWVSVHIYARKSDDVNASIVPGTFTYDAPLDGFDRWDHGIHFNLDKYSIQPGVTYNFSAVIKVEGTPPFRFKPQLTVGMGTYYNSTYSEGYNVEMPQAMLPDFVSHASVETNVSNAWSLRRHDQTLAELEEVSEFTGPDSDTTPPIILITSPINGSTLNIFNNTVRGTISDGSELASAVLYLNDQHVTDLTSGAFSVKVDYVPNASNNISVYAEDIYNNSNLSWSLVNVLPSSTNTTTIIPMNNSTTVDMRDEAETMVELSTGNNSAAVTINVTASTNASDISAVEANVSYGLAPAQHSLGRYIRVNVTGDRANITRVNLSMYYTESDLDIDGDGAADLNASTLTMYWYDANSTMWMLLAPGINYSSIGGPVVFGTGHNSTGQYIWADLNHFSSFALAANISRSEHICNLQPGWNMVSVPVVPIGGARVSDVFGSNVTTVFGWTGTRYQQIGLVDELAPKEAYWVLSNSGYDQPITGTPQANTSHTLLAGWNMVGPVSDGVSVETLDNVTTVFGWTGTRYQQITGAQELELTQGYWMLAGQNTVIQI